MSWDDVRLTTLLTVDEEYEQLLSDEPWGDDEVALFMARQNNEMWVMVNR